MVSSEHLNLTSPCCCCPSLPHPLFPCKGLATDRLRRFFPDVSRCSFARNHGLQSVCLCPPISILLALQFTAPQCPPSGVHLLSTIRLRLYSSFLTYLASSCHPTPLHLNLWGAPLESAASAVDRRFASSLQCQRDFS